MDLSYGDYTVAYICPMGVEFAPVKAMLDEVHPDLPTQRDQNSYTLGEIGGHYVVIAVLPEIGNSAAAVVATQILNDFPSIRFGLLVGIGGGVPNLDNEIDIRLGDIVVSKPTKTTGGVIQYDMGKETLKGFERTGTLDKPPAVLRAAVQRLMGDYELADSQVPVYLSQMLEKFPKMKEKYAYPGVEHDRLFETAYDHRGGNACVECDDSQVKSRPCRLTPNPVIHYGTIGSANRVIKNAAEREKLKSSDLDIICVEMEAAGLMNDFPCLVIRGICDYADSHKNKLWQPYAAATAAAYAKELLSVIPVAALNAKKSLPQKDTRSLDPSLPIDREALYSLFRASLSTEPVSRDASNAMQGDLFSELMLWKYHRQGPWNYWIYQNFVQEGRSVNVRDFRGKTPLHHALVTEYEREDKVRALVDAGADVAMKDFEDETPVDLAKKVNERLFIFLLRTWQQRPAPDASESPN